MWFGKLKSLEDVINKSARLTVLLKEIEVEDTTVNRVEPATCPGASIKNDVLKDNSGVATCVFNGRKCKYFVSANFNLNGFVKELYCRVK